MNVGFWTPIKCGGFSTLLEVVDAYFNVRGPIAWVSGKELKGCTPVMLYPGYRVWWQTALKVISYSAFLIQWLVNVRFPEFSQNKIISKLQTAISCLPVLMLAAKVALRAMSHFYLYTEGDDLIKAAVKITLDQLLGSCGAVDALPIYEFEGVPVANKMTAAIMKGKFKEVVPFIALKMECVNDKGTKSIRVLILSPHNSDKPLEWSQQINGLLIDYPEFFGNNFTSPYSGGVCLKSDFLRLQGLINPKIDFGMDRNGVHWKLIR
jgi:hypothetical protein